MTADRDPTNPWWLPMRAGGTGDGVWLDPLWRTIATIDPRAASGTFAGTDFEDTISRLLVLYELKKAGALTYDEFTVLKARLLGL